jgi:hypothetical protein
MKRRGFTTIESVLIVGTVAMAATVLWQLALDSRQVEAYCLPELSTQQDVSLCLTRITDEIRDATDIFYPAPAPAAAGERETKVAQGAGVGFTSANGDSIMYYLEDLEQDAMTTKYKPRSLYRVDLLTKKSERMATRVKRFQVVVPPHRLGKKIAHVNLELAIFVGAADDIDRGKSIDMITSAFARTTLWSQME